MLSSHLRPNNKFKKLLTKSTASILSTKLSTEVSLGPYSSLIFKASRQGGVKIEYRCKIFPHQQFLSKHPLQKTTMFRSREPSCMSNIRTWLRKNESTATIRKCTTSRSKSILALNFSLKLFYTTFFRFHRTIFT